MKVAYYSPLPPSRSGIADYSRLLLPALRERVDVVVAERGKRTPDADVALYHLGNEPEAHDWIVDALRKRPGVVVMHEYVLHHLVAGVTIGRGDGRGYLDAMERELGVAGRLLGLGVLDNLLPLLWETQPERFPLAGVFLDQATGVIAHSRYVAERARGAGYTGRIWRIPHPVWPLGDISPATDVQGEPLIGCFGYLNMNKRVGTPSAPADPATIPDKAKREFDFAVQVSGCSTPLIAENELFGAQTVTPWSATNAQYRANVLLLLQELAKLGATPAITIANPPYTGGEAADWWRQAAQTAILIRQVYFTSPGPKGLYKLGPARASRAESGASCRPGARRPSRAGCGGSRRSSG